MCVCVRAYMGVGPIMVPDFLLFSVTLWSQKASGSVSWERRVEERDTQRPCRDWAGVQAALPGVGNTIDRCRLGTWLVLGPHVESTDEQPLAGKAFIPIELTHLAPSS